ncbi:dynamin family protein [Actinomadura syzygii]|uniref:dynamin family protein n=1 Tax=Actinomadura syzygii TaxID=1427538 RepID=UPI001651E936|nr:dynamin family protein [Actinomadura syzygii]
MRAILAGIGIMALSDGAQGRAWSRGEPRMGASDGEFLAYLQADVRNALIGLDPLLDRAAELGLHSVQGGRGAEAARSVLHSDVRSIERMELRMPIIAPMNAGKSTIINALAGCRLLPARGKAMTTIPTRIILDNEIAEPVLEIAEPDVALFDTLLQELVQEHDETKREKATTLYRHLEPLLDQIAAGTVESCPAVVTGIEEIQRTLKRLNDLERVGAVLEAETSVVPALSDVPTLRSPVWAAPGSGGNADLGTLVLIDTPGPDEEVMSDQLTRVVREQLDRAHAVCVVLDYTKLHGLADEAIRKLAEPLLARVGVDRLIAVINKVDQRQPDEDGEGDDVVREVAHRLGVPPDEAADRVLETKAHYGLAAAGVLARLEESGENLDPSADPAVTKLLQLRSPLGWRHDVTTVTVPALRAMAEEAWLSSGLPGFRDRVLNRMRAEAAPVLLTGALDRTGRLLEEVAAAAGTRVESMRADQDEIAARIRELEAELAELAELARDAPSRPRVLTEAMARAKPILESTRDRGEDVLDGLHGSRTFSDGGDANKYAKKKRRKASERLEDILYDAGRRLEAELERLRVELIDEAEGRLAPVLARADVSARPPSADSPNLRVDTSGSIRGGSATPRKNTETYVTGHEEVEETLWEMLRRGLKGEPAPTRALYGEETTYKVKLGGVRRGLRDSFERRLARIEQNLEKVIAPALADHVVAFHQQATRLVSAYRDDLEASQRDLASETTTREMRQADLERLAKDALTATEQIDELRGQLFT